MGQVAARRRAKRPELDGAARFNRVTKPTNGVLSVLFVVLGLVCIAPLFFVIMISFTSEQSIARYGYQFIPQEFSLDAYKFLWTNKNILLDSVWVSLIVTCVGSVVGLLLTTCMGYVLSRSEYRFQPLLAWVVFIPMVFNGGLISTYFVNKTMLGLGDTLYALILPLLMSGFNVVICKTFFRTTLPDSIVESAKIDGASQYRIFFGIVLPISLPLLATIGLFLTFAYWNDWWQAMLYITKPELKPLQALLSSIERNVEYMLKNAATLGITQAQMRNTIPKESFRMAIAVVIILPISCAYPFFQRFFITGLTVGAVKG